MPYVSRRGASVSCGLDLVVFSRQAGVLIQVGAVHYVIESHLARMFSDSC